MIKTTKAQRKALFRVFQRDFPSHVTPFYRMAFVGTQGTVKSQVPSTQYRRFRAKVLFTEPELDAALLAERNSDMVNSRPAWDRRIMANTLLFSLIAGNSAIAGDPARRSPRDLPCAKSGSQISVRREPATL